MVSIDEPDYLLNDDEYVALMELQFKKAGRPQNSVAQKRVWNRLNKQSSKKMSWAVGLLLASAVALFIVNRPQGSDDLKSSSEVLDYEINIPASQGRIIDRSARDSIALTVRSQTAVSFSIFASGPSKAPQRLKASEVLEAGQTVQLEFPAAELAPFDRLCLVTGENAGALVNLEGMVAVLWPKLNNSRHCLQIQ